MEQKAAIGEQLDEIFARKRGSSPYVDFLDADDIILDGHFTAADIIAMADVLRSRIG